MLECSEQGWVSDWKEEQNFFQGKNNNILGATAVFYIVFSFFFFPSFPPLDLFLLYLPASKRIDETKNFPSAMATVLLCLSNFVWPLIIAKGVLGFFSVKFIGDLPVSSESLYSTSQSYSGIFWTKHSQDFVFPH